MSELHKNAIAFLQKRFPSALVLNNEVTFSDQNGVTMFKLYPMIAQDMQSGVKQRAIAIENLGSQGEVQAIAQRMGKIFDELDDGIYVKMGNALKPSGHEIDTNQMTYAPRILLYTNKSCVAIQQVIDIFSSVSALIDVVDESEMQIKQHLFCKFRFWFWGCCAIASVRASCSGRFLRSSTPRLVRPARH